MDSYIFIEFDVNIKSKEYKIYQKKMLKTFAQYFTVLTGKFKPNTVGKHFSICLSLGKETQTNQHYKNLFYKYLEYKSAFPDINEVVRRIAEIYSNFVNTSGKLLSRAVPQHNRADVIVFDMDDTLIDKNLKPFYNTIFEDLELYRKYFRFVVLWTHGTTQYLAEIELKFKFDLYISRNNTDSENKGLGAILRELNMVYGITKLDFCVLVDDSSYNFHQDYDLFVNVNKTPTKSSYKTTLEKSIVECMNNYYSKKSFGNEIYIRDGKT